MDRIYTFEGGCVMYQFEVTRTTGARVDEGSLAVGFLTRDEIEARFHR